MPYPWSRDPKYTSSLRQIVLGSLASILERRGGSLPHRVALLLLLEFCKEASKFLWGHCLVHFDSIPQTPPNPSCLLKSHSYVISAEVRQSLHLLWCQVLLVGSENYNRAQPCHRHPSERFLVRIDDSEQPCCGLIEMDSNCVAVLPLRIWANSVYLDCHSDEHRYFWNGAVKTKHRVL